jgi:hypothetical protein
MIEHELQGKKISGSDLRWLKGLGYVDEMKKVEDPVIQREIDIFETHSMAKSSSNETMI